MKGNRSTPARVAAGLLPIAVAGVLVTFRGVLDRADLVLILALVVVSVATAGDRIAAAIAAVSAAASFDFFLTQPYGSLRISSASDLENTALLLVIGLAVGQIAILGRDQQRKVVQAQQELERLEVVAARIASDPNVWQLVDLVQAQIVDTLRLDSCRFGLARPELPEMDADGRVSVSRRRFTDGEFALPVEGVALAVTGGGETVGWLRLIPGRSVGVSLEARKVAVALSQQLGAVLAHTGTERVDG